MKMGSFVPAVAAAVLVLAGCASDPTVTPVASSAPVHVPYPGDANVDAEVYRIGNQAGPLYSFVTPTRNVFCSIHVGGSALGTVGCQAIDSVSPDSAVSCTNTLTDMYAVRIDDAGAHHFCADRGIYGNAGDVQTLGHGRTIAVGGVVCRSDEATGVTCVYDGAGFTLSREIDDSF